MSDIVERLRAKHIYGAFEIEEQRREAADEIERLRKALDEMRELAGLPVYSDAPREETP